jgi:hypothetical protein
MNKVYVESIKELLRVVVLAVIPVLIDSLNTGEVNLRVLFVVGAVAGLRFIDKLLHEYGKEENNETLIKGITRF